MTLSFRLPLILLSVLGLTFSTLVDARMYRYLDESGQTVIANTVPREAVRRGYEVLNNQGRVIERVAPAPTEEELAQRKAEKERQQRQELQRQRDKLLLEKYSHPDDAVRALHRKIEEMRGLVQIKRGNISVLQDQLASEQARAANIERSGYEVPESVLEKITRLEGQIEESERQISIQNLRIEQVRNLYIQEISRLEELIDQPRTLPLDPGTP